MTITLRSQPPKQQHSLFFAIENVLKAIGLDLVELHQAKAQQADILRITISKAQGHIDHNDCKQAQLAIEALSLSEKYNLEISSPGIGRILKTERDYQIFAGKLIDVYLNEKSSHKQNQFLGYLQRRTEESIIIRNKDGNEHNIELDDIRQVSLALDLPSNQKQVEVSLEEA